MTVFSVLEGETVVLYRSGVFRQAKVYQYNDGLYAGYGSGFIRLHATGTTSLPTVRWENLSVDKVSRDRLGRLRPHTLEVVRA